MYKIRSRYLALKPDAVYLVDEPNGDSLFHLHSKDNNTVFIENNHGQFLSFDDNLQVKNVRKRPPVPFFLRDSNPNNKGGGTVVFKSLVHPDKCLGVEGLSPSLVPCILGGEYSSAVVFEEVSLNV